MLQNETQLTKFRELLGSMQLFMIRQYPTLAVEASSRELYKIEAFYRHKGVGKGSF